MTQFLSIQNTYNNIDIALFKDSQLIECLSEDKIRASKHFARMISDLLTQNRIKMSDLSFIAVNQGPGPFTTLRVVIASVNGLSFATNIPLVGVDALDAFLIEHTQPNYPVTIALLNAFNNDVYFGIQEKDIIKAKGYDNITRLLTSLAATYKGCDIRFLGNGVELHEKEIKAVFGSHAYIPQPLPHTCTVEQIGLLGLEKFNRQEGIEHQLFPLYLKQSITPHQ